MSTACPTGSQRQWSINCSFETPGGKSSDLNCKKKVKICYKKNTQKSRKKIGRAINHREEKNGKKMVKTPGVSGGRRQENIW